MAALAVIFVTADATYGNWPVTPSVSIIPVDGRIEKHPLYEAGLRPLPLASSESEHISFIVRVIRTVRSNRKIKPIV